jgi:hypothetical protein
MCRQSAMRRYEMLTMPQLSRPARDLTPFGRKLRAALFDDLHRLREELRESGMVGGATAASEVANGQAGVVANGQAGVIGEAGNAAPTTA